MRRISGLIHHRLIKDRTGAAVAEYGLVAAIVGAAIAVASLALGSAVTGAIEPAPAATAALPSG